MRGPALGLAVGLFVVACADDGGRLLVAVGTDFVVPSELAVVRARITGPEGADEVRSFQLAAPGGGDPGGALFEMPLSFVVEPRDGNAARRARIVIEGFARSESDPQPLVVARRDVSGFVAGRTSLLPVFLRRTCTRVTCPDDQTCERGVCESAAVDGASLPAATSPGEERRVLDALADASLPDASLPDASLPDAGARDAGLLAAPDASVVAAHAYGDIDLQEGWAIAVHSTGDLVIAGSYTGMLPMTGAPIAIGKDAFVARVMPSGAVVWIRTLAGSGDDEYRSVVLQGAAEEIVVAGYTDSAGGTWDFTSPITPGIVVAKFGANGDPGYGGVLPMDVTLAAEALSIGPALSAGPTETFLAWAGAGLSIMSTTIGTPTARRGFVAALHPEGRGTSGSAAVPQVNGFLELPTGAIPSDESQLSAVASSGASVFVGGYETGATGRHAYVAALTYDSADGSFTVVWERPDFLGAASNVETRALAIGSGSVYAAGIANQGGADVEDGFFAAFSDAGGVGDPPVVFGGPGEQLVYALARDADGRFWTAGGFFTGLVIDTPGRFMATGGIEKDMFLACFAPGGGALSAWAFPSGDGFDVIRALALPAPGLGYFVGGVSAGTTFPGLAPIGAGSSDVVFGRFVY